jgi:chemotaxis protein MotB
VAKKGDGKRPIIIKKEEVVEGGHHGGAWKVAYADFVTAMMAFFLLMWLLNATTEAQRRGLADYFTPSNLLSHNSSGSGQPFGGHTPYDAGNLVSDKGAMTISPGKSTATVAPDDSQDPMSSQDIQPRMRDETDGDPATAMLGQPPAAADASGGAGRVAADGSADGTRPDANGDTGALARTGDDQLDARGRQTGTAAGQIAKGQQVAGPANPGQLNAGLLNPGQAAAGQASAGQQSAGQQSAGQQSAGQLSAGQAAMRAAQQDAAADKATREQAQKALEQLQKAREQAEHAAFDRAAEQIREAVRSDPTLAAIANQIAIDQTPEGLRIQLMDEDRRPMFPSGSAVLNDKARLVLQKIAPILAKLSEGIAVSGHTDAKPYRGTDKTNWELSADRANATRRLLVDSGLPEDRFRSVSGKADRDLLLPADPFAAANRRIAIVALRDVQFPKH